ncbi:hypothetical protein [Hyphococcus sp.]|uniref:hypothetical protein n=1 Tax=Hyphococcus sp. TaxID=2038636 RepID=UPI0020886D90|nr:MAG: hypothetical protein DHS20C04_30740 [Marinicaulis sp.]
MIGYSHDVFYSLSIKEWLNALRAHARGDGHHKTHHILSMLAADVRNAHKSEGAPLATPIDFTPWLATAAPVAPASMDDFLDKRGNLKDNAA